MHKTDFKIFVNADDYGISKIVSESILHSIDFGIVNAVSIIPNGFFFKEGVDLLFGRDLSRISIHLNIVEAFPISDASKVELLTGSDGLLYHSPLTLWSKWLKMSRIHKHELENQIRYEFKQQIDVVMDSKISKLGIPVGIDSHQHIHLLPFVQPIMIDLLSNYQISYLRAAKEPVYSLNKVFANPHQYVKLLAFNHYSKRLKRLVESSSCRFVLPDQLFGAFMSGSLELDNFKAIGQYLRIQNGVGLHEIICHPGQSDQSESALWSNKPNFKEFYLSEKRANERSALTSAALISLFNELDQS